MACELIFNIFVFIEIMCQHTTQLYNHRNVMMIVLATLNQTKPNQKKKKGTSLELAWREEAKKAKG